jgi:SAM-dependent methyltransferase
MLGKTNIILGMKMENIHPQAIFIQLNTFCNAYCINCPHDFTYKTIHPKGRMNDYTWNKIISDLIQTDYRGQVGFYLHHEPLIATDLFEKINDVNIKTKAFVVISTNGALLNESNIENLVSSKPSKVHININSGDKAEYENSMKLNFEDTIQNIRNFINTAKGIIDIEINCPVMQGFNVKKLNDLFPDVIVNLDYAANSRGGLLPDLLQNQKKSRFNNNSFCEQPTQNFNILYDGSVIVCCMDWMHESKKDFRNIHQASIQDIYNDVKKINYNFERGDYSAYKMCKICSQEMDFNIEKSKIKVLLTNHHLLDYTGSEVYTFTLAEQLTKKGHEVIVYSRYVDKTKILFDEIGIRVIEDLEDIVNNKFDIAHVHHNINAMEVRNKFPELPIVYLSQGVLPFLEQPPIIDLHISKYFSISDEVMNNLISAGIPQSEIIPLGNMIDEIKFLPKNDINENPRNALVISGRIDSEKENVIRNSCLELNINLKFVGGRFGEVSQPDIKTLIEESDIVFSLGRGAIEAMMMGRAVIIYDYLGGDGMVTENNFAEIKQNNFSGRRFKKNFTVNELIDEIKKYDKTSVMNVRNLAIQNFSASILTDLLLEHYENVIATKNIPLNAETKKLLKHFINTINETRNYSLDIAARRYNKMMIQKPDENNLYKAEQLIENNNYPEAKLVLTEMLKENPIDIDALNNLAVITILEDNFDEADKIISLVLRLDSTNEVALGNLEYLKQQLLSHTPEEFEVNTFSSYDDFKNYSLAKENLFKERTLYEKSLVEEEETYTIPGYCKVCESDSNFLVDYLYAYQNNGTKIPNWRERLVCPKCGLNNRMRAAIHLLKTVTKPKPDARIYISEQTTHLYQYFLKNYPNTVGSEYLGDKYKPGEINESGIRNEDFTNLSFSDNEFDLVLSFEVFEHIPNFINAFSESLRTLKPGGHLIFTVPFNMNSKSNLVRAMIKNGIVEHIHPPEYHGDPVNSSEGCLCFYHFGWEVLEQLKTTGFEDVNAMSFYSKKFGYLGGEQLFFVAEKSKCENSLIKEYEDLKQNNLIAENV